MPDVVPGFPVKDADAAGNPWFLASCACNGRVNPSKSRRCVRAKCPRWEMHATRDDAAARRPRGRSGTAKPLLPPANYIDALGGSRLFPGSSQEASRTARRALQNEEPPIHERCITFVLPDPPGHANHCAADSAPTIKLRPRPMALAKRLVTFPLAVGRLPVASGCC
jgi:hypothetical protein